jgi:hypothetical protein
MVYLNLIRLSLLTCLWLALACNVAGAEPDERRVLSESFFEDGKISNNETFELPKLTSGKAKRSKLPLTVNYPFVQILTCGDSSRCVDLVFLSEGYQTSELPVYHKFVESMVKKLFSVAPFKTYKSFFNVYRIDVSSAQSGISPNNKNLKDTAFLASPGCGRGTTSLCGDIETIKEVASRAVSWDYAAVIINEPTTSYGVAYVYDNVTILSGNIRTIHNTLIHELGHLIGKLADEYDFWGPLNHSKLESFAPNITVLDKKKWAEWQRRKLPSEYDGPTGLYEGGDYSKRGVFRPSPNSRMRDITRPFNAPSAEAIILSILRHSMPLDYRGFTTPDTSVPGSAILSPTDSVSYTPPSFPSLKTKSVWTLSNETGTKNLKFGTTVFLDQVSITEPNNYLDLTMKVSHPFLISKFSKQALGGYNTYWYVVPENIVSAPREATIDIKPIEGKVEIAWSPYSNRTDGKVEVYRSTTGALCMESDLQIETTDVKYVDSKLELNTNYKYSLRARDLRGFSDCVEVGDANLKLLKTKISGQPKTFRTVVGHLARFKVFAEGNALTFNWFENGLLIAGETNDSLTLEASSLNRGKRYSVKVSGLGGSVLSKSARLEVITPK